MRTAGALVAGAAILATGILLRFHYAAFLDPFEDGYQNWWISSNLLTTGQYWDRHSMMTNGNWLPLYHFFGAGVLLLAGPRNFAALKSASIALSAATAGLVFLASRKQSLFAAFAGMTFFSLNFIDVVISGWTTAESLGTFLVFLAYVSLFWFQGSRPRNRWIAAIALALAVMTRYEAWVVATLFVVHALVRKAGGPSRRELFLVCIPALAFMTAYFIYSLQWGFLPEIVVRQTSTDVRYQLSVGTQKPALEILSRWWWNYLAYFPAVLLVGGGYTLSRIRKDVGSWIVVALWGFVLFYTVLQWGNPSYRYVMLTVPLLSLYAAMAFDKGIRLLQSRSHLRFLQRKFTLPVTLAATIVLASATMLPSAASCWDSGFSTSQYMVPLKRAGEFVSTLPIVQGKILISESPIAAYYSTYPPDRVLGSRWLPDSRVEALHFLKENVAYVVYMGVPYYKMRLLFPDLQNGTSTPDFEFLFDAGGREIGTHAVFVYRVIP